MLFETQFAKENRSGETQVPPGLQGGRRIVKMITFSNWLFPPVFSRSALHHCANHI